MLPTGGKAESPVGTRLRKRRELEESDPFGRR